MNLIIKHVTQKGSRIASIRVNYRCHSQTVTNGYRDPHVQEFLLMSDEKNFLCKPYLQRAHHRNLVVPEDIKKSANHTFQSVLILKNTIRAERCALFKK